MKHLKLMFAFLAILFAAITVTSCDPDNDDDKILSGGDGDVTTSGGDGKTSGWVEIGKSKFNVKYGYIVDYSDYDDGIEFTFSDTDLSNIYKGKSFKKTISLMSFYFYDDIYDAYDAEIDGGYKVYYDSDDEYTYNKAADSFYFCYEGHDNVFNPRGSSFETDRSGKKYTFTGDGLKAEIFTEDEDFEDNVLGLRSFDFSVEAKPEDITDYIMDMETRGIEMTIITDPQEKALFRKFFAKKQLQK